MKKIDFKKQYIIFLSILLSIILAGLLVYIFLDFNGDSTTSSITSIEIATENNTLRLLEEEKQKEFLNAIEKKVFPKYNIKVNQSAILNNGYGDSKLQYIVQTNFDNTYFDNISQALTNDIASLQYLQQGDKPVVSCHYREYHAYFRHIWSILIAVGVAMLLWVVYMMIRFRFAMAMSAIIMLILDSFSMLGLVALCRIPVGFSLVGALVLTILLSVTFSTFMFANMYANFKKENWQDKTLLVAISQSSFKNRKVIIMISAFIAIALACLTIGAGIFAAAFDLFGFALSSFFGVSLSAINAIYCTPSLFYNLQKLIDDRKICERRVSLK